MALDKAETLSEILASLPIHARWMLGGTPLDFDFTQARRGLRKLARGDVIGGLDQAWADLLVFGNYDYAEGGGASGWITIRECDGSVCGLDVEREPAIFEYNSSLGRFLLTFKLIDRYLARGRPLSPAVVTSLGEIDPDCYSSSEWRLLTDDLNGE